MKVKEIVSEDFLVKKFNELEELRCSVSEFETRLTEIINNKQIEDSSKVIMIRSAYQKTIGTLS